MMKGSILNTCLLTTLLAPVLATAADLPSRKAGLWEITMTVAGLNMTQTVKQCIDAATDAKMLEMGKESQAQPGMKCTSGGPRKDGAGYVAESSCSGNGTKMTTRSVFTGDFQSTYRSESTTKFTPPVSGFSEQKMTMDAHWKGPCEAGQRPGDMIMPGGIKMNIDSM